MTAYKFVNALRILHSIDQFEVKFLSSKHWPLFRDAPYKFMMQADDATAEKIWAIVCARQPKDKS